MVARPSAPESGAFIRQMLCAAGYRLVAQRNGRIGRGRYLRRTYLRTCNDRYHLELWEYVDTRDGRVLFMDLSLWANGDLAPGRAVRYIPVRNDLTDVFGAFSDEKTGIGTLSRELSSRTTGAVKRRAYKYAPDARRLGFDDNGGSSPSGAPSSRVA